MYLGEVCEQMLLHVSFLFIYLSFGIEDKVFIKTKKCHLLYTLKGHQIPNKIKIEFRSIIILCQLKEGENLKHHNYVLKPGKAGTEATGSNRCAGSACSLTHWQDNFVLSAIMFVPNFHPRITGNGHPSYLKNVTSQC